MANENAVRSKIPIPKKPLPLISENIIKRCPSLKRERGPLKTIYVGSENLDGIAENVKSVKKVLRRSKSVVNENVDRHVTLRQKSEELDWSYKVFTDKLQSADNDLTDKGDHVDKGDHADKGETSKSSTPELKGLLEPSRVRNIKRSLKRPHSRELQGISPTVSDDKIDEKHKRKLVFTDRFDDKNQQTDLWLNCYANSLNHNYGVELYNYLMKNETVQEVPIISSNARACVMNWLVKVNGPGGNPAAVQTAAWYFDTILTVGHVSVERLQVLAAACYWISLKIQGKVVTAKTLVRKAANAFSIKYLISAEKAVMTKLEFPIQPILAQDFIDFMSWDSDASNYMETERAATLIYMATLVVKKELCSNYPSVLAAAAVRNALNLLQRTESLAKLETNSVYKAATEKQRNFDFLISLQRFALYTMSFPYYEYRALLENAQDRSLIEKILTVLKVSDKSM